MNIGKIQQEILKQLIADASRVKYFDAPEDKVFITTDGKVGYILPEEEIHVKLAGAQISLSLYDDIMDSTALMSNLLMETDEYRLGGKARKYLRSDDPETEIYVNQDLLKNFDHPQLWQAPGNQNKAIAVTEIFCSDGAPVPVGIVCPVKVNN
jgi:hypothetical protein